MNVRETLVNLAKLKCLGKIQCVVLLCLLAGGCEAHPDLGPGQQVRGQEGLAGLARTGVSLGAGLADNLATIRSTDMVVMHLIETTIEWASKNAGWLLAAAVWNSVRGSVTGGRQPGRSEVAPSPAGHVLVSADQKAAICWTQPGEH